MKFARLMNRVEALERDLARSTQPWPPEHGFAVILWETLGRPVKRMSFIDMYLAAGEKFYAEKKDCKETRQF